MTITWKRGERESGGAWFVRPFAVFASSGSTEGGLRETKRHIIAIYGNIFKAPKHSKHAG